MKTGFICASGYNLVASATRNGKRLIAVILGAYGGGVRAQKAAQLLESGFNGNNLSWLKPSLGNVENLVPINAAPPNLRDEMCGKHRRKPPSEENSEEEEASSGGNGTETGDNSDSQQNFSMSSLKYQPGKFVLGPSIPAAPPIEVFIGPAKGAGADAKPAKQIKAGLTPPKTSPWKTPDSASDPKADNSAADQADEKPAKPVKHAKPKAKSAAKTAAKKKPEQ
jgi:D-alanyl-D-alanine carboxypeptidase